MNPYEVLGVAPDATQDQIRVAYKKKARLAHPDRKGGSEALMSALNVAKEILLDPRRRLSYDKNGEGFTPEKTVEQKAVDIIMQCFGNFLNEAIKAGVNIDIVKRTDVALQLMIQTRVDRVRQIKREMLQLKDRRDAVRYKGRGTNLYQQLIDSATRDLQQTLDKVQEELPMFKCALDLLIDYQGTGVEGPPMRAGGSLADLLRGQRGL